MGSSDYATPALDRLASEGVRFTQAYANAPLCHGRARYGLIPSRSELQMKKTGKASTTIRANKRKAKLKAKHRLR
jgi:arylsulfatase A-like enzyme